MYSESLMNPINELSECFDPLIQLQYRSVATDTFFRNLLIATLHIMNSINVTFVRTSEVGTTLQPFLETLSAFNVRLGNSFIF
jgi:hypothetical protein